MTSRFLSKFIDAKQIGDTIDDVVKIARDEGVDIALAGGVALQLYGSDRLTKDVDFIADRIPEGVEAAKKLSFGGIKTESSNGVPFDIIVRDDGYKALYEEALSHAKFDSDLGIKVVSPEYIAAMKLLAGRIKDEEDLRTIIGLDAADMEVSKDILKRHIGQFAVEELESFIYEVRWRMQKEREGE